MAVRAPSSDEVYRTLNTLCLEYLSIPHSHSSSSLAHNQDLFSPTNPMPDEIPKTSSTTPQHIGQIDEPRELLDLVDRVHSTG